MTHGHCRSFVTSQQPSVRWTSTAGIPCTGQQSSLCWQSWTRCCTVRDGPKLFLHTASAYRLICVNLTCVNCYWHWIVSNALYLTAELNSVLFVRSSIFQSDSGGEDSRGRNLPDFSSQSWFGGKCKTAAGKRRFSSHTQWQEGVPSASRSVCQHLVLHRGQ